MYEELIKALQLHCEAGKKIGLRGAIWTLLDDASTALKSMTAQLAALQAENTELKRRLDEINDFGKSQCAKLLVKLARVEAERDALAALINKSALKPIQECKHYKKCYQKAADEMHMMKCPICDHWECRGAQGEG